MPKTAKPRKKRLWLKAILWAFLAGGLYLGGDFARILVLSRQSSAEKADAAIVLGASAWNGRPSPVLASRVDHAVDLYKKHQVKWLLFTGGSAKGDPSSEGQAGVNYAVQKGVPRAACLAETKSKTTYENVSLAEPIAREHGIHSVLVVSDGPHVPRGVEIASGVGFNAYPSPTETSLFKSRQAKLTFAWHEVLETARYRASLFVPGLRH
ncbi:MAG: YdcF family protein [Armatimonadota bacterium]